MNRRRALIATAGMLLASVPGLGAAQPKAKQAQPKAKRAQPKGKRGRRPGPQWKVGDEGVVAIRGDEGRFHRGVVKAGAVKEDSIIIFTDARNFEDYREYNRAIDAGDALGIDMMIEDGKLARIDRGTKVLILEFSNPGDGGGANWRFFPAQPGVIAKVRVLDGPKKGTMGSMLTRNLDPAPAEAKKAEE